MRRRRFLTALVIIASALTLNVYVDYLLILRNPAELEVMVNEALKAIAPDYAPRLGSVVEFSLSERRVVFSNLEFHEKGRPENPLLEVARVEATLSLVPPALSQITLIEPEAVLRVDREGHVTPALGGGGEGAPSLLSDLNVRVRRGRLRVINDYQGLGSETLLSDLNASIDIQTDLSVKGSGMARFGALFPEGDLRARGGTRPPGTPAGKLFKDVFPVVSFDVDGPSDGPLKAEVQLARGSHTPQLRSIIPTEFEQAIWRELNPRGGNVSVRLRLLVNDQGTSLHASVRPRGVTIEPRGFPIPIEDVGGAFEVSLALAHGQELPEILSVSWEHTHGHVAGGRVVSRGVVFPGDPHERTTLYVFIDANDLHLSPALVAAIPPDIRKVYQTFDPQGVVKNAKVQIVGGPHEAEPDLFVEVGELDGAISAMHLDYPMRLEDVHGSFSLKPGPSVEVEARGRLEHGGRAEVSAQVLAGELIHVDVKGRDVPVGEQVLQALPPSVQRYVRPFRPSGGTANFHAVVAKEGPEGIATPHVEIQLQDVGIRHEELPYPVTASGTLVVDPVFARDAKEEDSPERIGLDLDLQAHGPGLERLQVQGPLAVGLSEEEGVHGDLQVGVTGLELNQLLLDALPEELAAVRDVLQPQGRVAAATARVHSPEQFEVQGSGDGLRVALQPFPYPLGVRLFHVSRDGDRVTLHRTRGTCPDGGQFSARGTIVLSPEEGQPPLVDVTAQARNVHADAQLMRAVPGQAVRDFLLSLRPDGRLDADVSAQVTPGIGNQPEVLVDLKGVDVYLDQIAPELARFRDEPLRDVHGRIRIEVPEQVTLEGLQGTLAGAQVQMAGVVGQAAPTPAELAASSLGGTPGAAGAWAAERLSAPMSLSFHVSGFDLNEDSERLLGPRTRDFLASFPASGPLAVDGLVERGRLDPQNRLQLRFLPQGLRVVPGFLQVPLEGVTGFVDLEDGVPARIDLSGNVGEGHFRLRRDQAQERAFPDAGRDGMVLHVDLEDLRRPDDPARRTDFQRLLPRRVAQALDDANPAGPLDMQAVLYLPEDLEGTQPIEWLAEVRPRGFSVSAGVRLDDMQGVIRVAGSVSELERGSAAGEMRLEQMDWKKQTIHHMHGPFRLEHGVLTLGERDRPLMGQLYGGTIAALIEYRLAEGAYRGWLELRDGLVARCLDELNELRSEPPEPSTSSPRPLTGLLYATMDFQGGGRGLDGRTRPFRAEGVLHARETNLVEVKAFDWLRTVRDAFRGETSKPEAFETMHVDYGMTLDRVTLRAVRLDSPSLILVGGEDLIQGGEGWIRLSDDPDTNGDIFLDLTPFDTGSTVLDNLLQMSVPLTGVTVRAKVYAPQVIVGVPFYGAAEKIWRGFLDEDKKDEEQKQDEGD